MNPMPDIPGPDPLDDPPDDLLSDWSSNPWDDLLPGLPSDQNIPSPFGPVPIAESIDPFNLLYQKRSYLDAAFEDDISQSLSQVEDSIENSVENTATPLPADQTDLPRQDQNDTYVDQVDLLHQNHNYTHAPPKMETGSGPPLPDEEAYRMPTRPSLTHHYRPTGSGAGLRHHYSPNENPLCPLTGNRIPRQLCQGTNCQHLDPETGECGYFYLEETDADGNEEQDGPLRSFRDQEDHYY